MSEKNIKINDAHDEYECGKLLGLMLDVDLSDTKPDNEKIIECKGQIYRCRINVFRNGNGDYIRNERFVHMKRLSCPGCDRCSYLPEYLDEQICNDGNNEAQLTEDESVHGALYKLRVCNVSTDWESGYTDDWDTYFVKIKE